MELPPEIWEIIAEDWRIWRCLQQCNRYLFAVMGGIDPYKRFTAITKRNVFTNGFYIYWRAGRKLIKTIYIFSDTVIIEMLGNGQNYFYDNRYISGDDRAEKLYYLNRKGKPEDIKADFIDGSSGEFVRSISKIEFMERQESIRNY